MKIMKIKTILGIVSVSAALLTSSVICNASTGSGKFFGKNSTILQSDFTKYNSGQYKIGTDVPDGEYILFASGGTGYFCVSSDSNETDIILNNNFENNSIITVNDGEYLNLTRCFAIPLSENPDVDLSETGMFLVGTHMPEGEYKIDSGSQDGYYCIYADSRQDNIIANDNFQGTKYVTVSNGQYLELVRCKFVDIPEKPEKVYTDKETIKKVQETLNSEGFDCGTADGIAGQKTTDAISNYQKSKGITVNGKITEELLSLLGLVNGDSNNTLETEFVATGIGLMGFLSAVENNGYTIIEPNRDGSYVTAIANGTDGNYKIKYMVENQKVYSVSIFAETIDMLTDTGYLNCVSGIAKSINSNIDESTIDESVYQAMSKPDSKINNNDTLFRYDSINRAMVISY